MSELETAQELAETAVRQVNVFALQGDKVDFLINQLKQIASLPQLTIPKSIAEILGKYDGYNPTADKLIMMAYRDYQDWIIKDWVKNDNIARAYLVGKALGVDLVKVVADENI